ncbi:hypothetical protein EDC01DRAFT_385661 [Geopyxis carbonaria]|nr:hypothetical protein EDC01DRAFT_385661 [Geopyxis carbonaria]
MDGAGLALAVIQITCTVSLKVYNYTKDVASAPADMRALSSELFALIGIFERVRAFTEAERHHPSHPSHPSPASAAADLPPAYSPVSEKPVYTDDGEIKTYGDGDEGQFKTLPQLSSQPGFRRVLSETVDFLQDLERQLEPPRSRGQRVRQMLKWPFKEAETQKHLQRLERVKSFFVLSVMTNDANTIRDIADQISDLRVELDRTREGLEMHSQEAQRRIRELLCPISPATVRDKVAKARVPGSGVWFTEGEKFKSWVKETGPAFLWLNGITGAGKTTLMTTAVDSLLSTSNAKFGVAYFYCSFSVDDSQNLTYILGSLLSQLCPPGDPILHYLHERILSITHGSSGAELPVEELRALILRKARTQLATYLFLDAANECADPFGVLTQLAALAAAPDCHIHVFLSSINERGIDTVLRAVPGLLVETVLPRSISADVDLLIHASLDAHPRLRQHPASLKAQIVAKLSVGAQGMFRWVQCQLERLGKLRTPGAIADALERLPKTLDKTYEDLLLRIDDAEDRSLAREILELVAMSLQPLTLRQLTEALQITPGLAAPDTRKLLADRHDILSICGSLLSCDPSTEVVTLAHPSVRTYLTSPAASPLFALSAAASHAALAERCLAYLSYTPLAAGAVAPAAHARRAKALPFLHYAARHWPLHLARAGYPPALVALSHAFLTTPPYAAWVQSLLPAAIFADPLIAATPPLYYAASFGLLPLVRRLLQEGAQTSVYGGRGRSTPLNIAVFRGYSDIVSVLLQAGADPLWRDAGEGPDAYEWANLHGLRVKSVLEQWRRKKGGGKGEGAKFRGRTGSPVRMDKVGAKFGVFGGDAGAGAGVGEEWLDGLEDAVRKARSELGESAGEEEGDSGSEGEEEEERGRSPGVGMEPKMPRRAPTAECDSVWIRHFEAARLLDGLARGVRTEGATGTATATATATEGGGMETGAVAGEQGGVEKVETETATETGGVEQGEKGEKGEGGEKEGEKEKEFGLSRAGKLF